MKKHIITCVIAILLCTTLHAQWQETMFEEHTPAISAFSDLVLNDDGSMIIYRKTIGNTPYFYTSDNNGATWERKSIAPALNSQIGQDACWGYSSIRKDALGLLQLSLKYQPCYSHNQMDYTGYQSPDNGTSWQPSGNTATGETALQEGESLWFNQALDANKAVMVSIGSYTADAGNVYVYKTTDGGAHWNRTPVSLGGSEVSAYSIAGLRFADENKGTLFLSNQYLTTTDGGQTWEEHIYPVNQGFVTSVDFTDEQHIYAATYDADGTDVYLFSQDLSTAMVVYHADKDRVYKVKCKEADVHLLTVQGKYVRKIETGIISKHVLQQSDQFLVYPNPSVTEITISAAGSLKGNVVKLFDINGKLIATVTCNNDKVTINTKSFAAGNYFAELQTASGKRVAIMKWVKK